MKRLIQRYVGVIFVFALCVCLLSANAWAEEAASGTCGKNITWSVENGVLSLSGEGDMAAYIDSADVPWSAFSGDIKCAVIDSGVMSIGDYAFYGCNELEHVLFVGTDSPWDYLSVGGFNDPLLEAEYCCVSSNDDILIENGCEEIYLHCSACDRIIILAEIAGGEHSYGEWYETKAADCEEAGEKCRDCQNCDYTDVAEIDALGHVEEIEIPEISPTCGGPGVTAKICCAVCGEVLQQQELMDPLEHNLGPIEAVDPTCTEEGLTEGVKCTMCNMVFVKQKVVPATGHTEVVDDPVAATCTTDGSTVGIHCGNCGEVLFEPDSIPALGHKETLLAPREATCTEAGSTGDTVCTVCGEVTIPGEAIPAPGHDEVVVPGYAATYEEAGLTDEITCNTCGETLQKATVIPALKTYDVDGDGDADVTDLVVLMKYIIGAETGVTVAAPDVNGDDKEDVSDVIRLMEYLAKTAV